MSENHLSGIGKGFENFDSDIDAETLINNAGSSGTGYIESTPLTESQLESEPTLSLPQLKEVVSQGIALRVANVPWDLEKQVSFQGDALALYNLGSYLPKGSEYHDLSDHFNLWKFQTKVDKDISTLDGLDLSRYVTALRKHLHVGIFNELYNNYKPTDKFEAIFADLGILSKSLPTLYILSCGSLSPVPHDLDRFYGLGKFGTGQKWQKNQLVTEISLDQSDLQELWDSTKGQLSGKTPEDEDVQQVEIYFNIFMKGLVTIYLKKIVTQLEKMVKTEG
jgi:hypothetical protein